LQNLMGAGGTPHQAGAALEAHGMGDAVAGEGKCLPGRIIGARTCSGVGAGGP
jgi:hypothetical protein